MFKFDKKVKFALILFPLICVLGCQTTKAPQSSSQLWEPTEQIEQQDEEDDTWSSLKDHGIDTSSPFSLIDLIKIALERNPDTKDAWYQAQVAQAREKQAESKYYPQISVSADASNQKKTKKESSTWQYGPGIDLTYLLLDCGGRQAEVDEMYQNLVAANFQFNQDIHNLILNTAKAYYELYGSYSDLKAQEDNVTDARVTLESAQEKCIVGIIAKPDLLKAHANYNDALYNLENAQGNLKDAKGNLAILLALPADTSLEITPPDTEIPTGIAEEDVSILIEEALIQRPDISALIANLQAKEAAVRVANSSLLPYLGLSGSGNKDWYEYDYSYSTTLGVQWDIFTGFYNLNEKQAAIADLNSARSQLISAQLSASSDVWVSYYGFKTAVGKLKFARAYLNSAQSSYDLELASYDTGYKGILDLLDSQSSLSDARSKFISSEKDLFVSLVELANSVGLIYTGSEFGILTDKEFNEDFQLGLDNITNEYPDTQINYKPRVVNNGG